MVNLLAHERMVAVVDVGSGHVGCAFLKVASSGQGTVISHARAPLSLESRTTEQSRARIAEEVEQAVKLAQDVGGGALSGAHISAVYIVVHAPWTVPREISAAERYPESLTIHAEHIVKLARSSLMNISIDRAHFFEASVIASRLNGYFTNAPEGKRARYMEIASIVTTCDPALKAAVEGAVHAAFPVAKLFWRSEERVATDVLRRVRGDGDVVLVSVDIGATHVITMRGGVPVSQRVVDEGMQAILARVHGSEAPAETLSLFRMFARDACATEACAALAQKIAEAEPRLAHVFGEAFAALAQTERLPNDLLLIVHPDIEPWLATFFARLDFAQFTLTALPFTIEAIERVQLAEWIAADPMLDPALALASVHAVVEEQST